jgi:hypothetical protein
MRIMPGASARLWRGASRMRSGGFVQMMQVGGERASIAANPHATRGVSQRCLAMEGPIC